MIVCRPGKGSAFKARLARWLEACGLALNENKTRVLDSRQNGFEFLGFTFRWQRSRKGGDYVHTEPSAKSCQRLRERLRELTPRSSTWKSAEEIVGEIKTSVRGWGNYFAHRHYGEVFGQMRWVTHQRLRHWQWRKHGQRGSKYQRWPEQGKRHAGRR